MILGIDPGLSCGWAIIGDGDRRIGSGAWDLSVRSRWEGAGVGWLRLQHSLQVILGAHQIEAIGFEEVRRHAGTDAAHVYGAIVGVIQHVAEAHGTPYTSIPVGTIKRIATGKGNAGKDEMIAAVMSRWGHRCETDDEADAHWVAVATAREIGRRG
jgi:Holliday junction resolvasome RuvABC endonuclease subunit